MGLNIKRVALTQKDIKDDYSGVVTCNKPRDEAIEYLRGYMQPKKTKLKYTGFNYHLGNYTIKRDDGIASCWNIEGAFISTKLISMQGTEHETYRFQVMCMGEVATQVKLSVRGYDAKACFEDFKEDFLAAVPDCKTPPKPALAIAVDFTGVSMLQALEAFDKVIDQFGANVNVDMFKKLRAFKVALTNKINSLPFQEKGKFSQPMGQIDMFISTMDGQFANPAMASSVASFAGTYVAQMKAAVGSMASMA
jgi:hypothetical protein